MVRVRPCCLKGQVPIRLGTAGASKRAEAAFDEGADLSDLAQGAQPRAGAGRTETLCQDKSDPATKIRHPTHSFGLGATFK